MLEQMGRKGNKNGIKLDKCQLKLKSLLSHFAAEIAKENKSGFLKKIKRLLPLNSNEHRGAYIYGAVGRGKSMLLKEFFDGLATKRKIFVHFHKFMSDFHSELNALNSNGGSSSDNHVKQIVTEISKKYSVIVLDELQINNISDAMIVGRLFKELIEKGTFVFFSSNRHPNELFKDGLQRERFLPFIRYIKKKLELFELNNFVDYRLEILDKASDLYFSPLNKDAQKKFWDLVNKVIGGHPLEEENVRVDSNRSIKVLNSYGNVAVFTFKELCEIPLGARDYMALCRHYNTIVVQDIPKMCGEKHNEALRFITLIDCMYNSGTTVICLAAAEPHKLYTTGKNSFEFNRTASRLSEMRTFEYRHIARENSA